MEHYTKIQIVIALKEYMHAHDLKQSDIAKKSGVNAAYVNIILKEDSNFMYSASGKTGNIPVANFNKIAELIGFKIEKTYWETQPTDQLTAQLSILQDAKEHATTNVIIGETGSGKSLTAHIFAKKHPSDTFIITVGSSDSLNALIDKVCEAVVPVAAGNNSVKIRSIAMALRGLKNKGLKPQLIFDESEYMRQPALCTFKALYDGLHGYCSIVLIGTDQLITNLEKLRKKNAPGIPQLYRRIKFGIRTLPSINRSFDQFIIDIEDPALKKWLKRHCNNYGELHDALVPVYREAERTNTPITVPFLKQVLNLNEADYL